LLKNPFCDHFTINPHIAADARLEGDRESGDPEEAEAYQARRGQRPMSGSSGKAAAFHA